MANWTDGITIGSMLQAPENYVMRPPSQVEAPPKISRKVKRNSQGTQTVNNGVWNIGGEIVKPPQKEQVKVVGENFDAGAGLSMPAGEGLPDRATGVDRVANIMEKKEARETNFRQAQLMASGLQFMAEVWNANNAYRSIDATAQLNITQSKNQEADALNRGRQAGLNAQSEGYQNGQDALLNASAQGQDVRGAAVKKIQGSYEAMGYYNQAQEEINGYREALGYELEQVNFDYQVKSASINKDFAIIGSALNFGANAYAYGR